MAYFSTSCTRITGISSCVPSHRVYTRDYDQISAEERELFIKTTGIEERRAAADNVTCSDLCYQAALDLLKRFGPEDIDVLIFVSQSPDYYLPATSILLQERLGLQKTCLAFDISLGCSGYVYGLSVMANMLQSGQLKKGLLLVGDKSTTSTSYQDKSTYPLFGDAGTATMIVHDGKAGNWHFDLQSNGAGKNSIIIEHGHSRNPFKEDFEQLREISPGITRAKKHLALEGADIFNFALQEVAPNINHLLATSGIGIEQIDQFIFHQANRLINQSVRKKLKIDDTKVPSSIEKFGNTSSASIPLTICHKLANTQERKILALLSGFGVGYSWGSAILELDHIYTSLSEHV